MNLFFSPVIETYPNPEGAKLLYKNIPPIKASWIEMFPAVSTSSKVGVGGIGATSHKIPVAVFDKNCPAVPVDDVSSSMSSGFTNVT